MLIDILNRINSINENMFSGFDSFINQFNMPDWLCDAIIDSFHVLPLIFIVFLFIELIEYFYEDKINNFMKGAEKAAPLIGSIAAIIPQCGFSVIASTLYIRKFITKGTLIAIYLATSDEAIPILLANPAHMYYVLPIIGIKIVIAIIAGYLIDFILKDNKYIPIVQEADKEKEDNNEEEHEGCCHHSVSQRRKREIIIHPIKHTLNIFMFILGITILLNFLIFMYGKYAILHTLLGKIKILEPIITAFVGLIPNCAVSIALTMLLIKGSISFGAVMAGLLSNAGLGILILFRHNKNIKDTMKIIAILLSISIVSGMIIQIF